MLEEAPGEVKPRVAPRELQGAQPVDRRGNQPVRRVHPFATKSFARSSGEEPASPRHRAGVASSAWSTRRNFDVHTAVDVVELEDEVGPPELQQAHGGVQVVVVRRVPEQRPALRVLLVQGFRRVQARGPGPEDVDDSRSRSGSSAGGLGVLAPRAAAATGTRRRPSSRSRTGARKNLRPAGAGPRAWRPPCHRTRPAWRLRAARHVVTKDALIYAITDVVEELVAVPGRLGDLHVVLDAPGAPGREASGSSSSSEPPPPRARRRRLDPFRNRRAGRWSPAHLHRDGCFFLALSSQLRFLRLPSVLRSAPSPGAPEF